MSLDLLQQLYYNSTSTPKSDIQACKNTYLLYKFSTLQTKYASVAELVDALDSKSSIRKDVRVRVSPEAHITKNRAS